MPTIDHLLLIIGASLSALYLFYALVYPALQVKAPTKTIIELIKSGEIEVVDGYDDSFKESKMEEDSKAFVDFTLIDRTRNQVTWVSVYFGGTCLSGSFKWMNEHEEKRIISAARKISNNRDRHNRDIERTRREVRDIKLRQEAKVIYEGNDR